MKRKGRVPRHKGVTKTELIKELQQTLKERGINLTREEVKTIIEELLFLIEYKVMTDGAVSFRDFGTFRKISRSYRLPKGKSGHVFSVVFTAGKGFKELINNKIEF